MKIFGLIFFSLLIATPAIADLETDRTRHGSFDRTVSELTCDAAQTLTRTGKDGIKVTCITMPCEQLIAVAWEIYNPQKITLDITPESIKLYNQVRERESVLPVQAAGMLYGTRYNKPVADPFIDAAAPSSYDAPSVQSASAKSQDIIKSAFNFGKTNAVKTMGVIYYVRLGRNEKLTSMITLNGQTLKFEFL